jgi:hypothetical protein
MAYVSDKTIPTFKANTPLCTVIAFGAGAILSAFEGRLLPEGLWIYTTYGCFAASTLFGIAAMDLAFRTKLLRQRRRDVITTMMRDAMDARTVTVRGT